MSLVRERTSELLRHCKIYCAPAAIRRVPIDIRMFEPRIWIHRTCSLAAPNLLSGVQVGSGGDRLFTPCVESLGNPSMHLRRHDKWRPSC